MNGISAIITFDQRPPDETLRGALRWTHPPFGLQESATKTHTIKNVSIGTTSGETIAWDHTEKVWVVFCGQLLHKERLGKEYAHLSDAACIVELYSKEQSALFSKLDGEFAFVILDTKAKVLYAVRDRLGCYPLYWHVGPNLAIVATSLKAILSTGVVSPTPDMMGIAASQTLGFISQDATSISDTNRLMGGYYLRMSFDGTFKVVPYWSFSASFERNHAKKFDSSLDIYCELERRIKDSIDARKSDSPCCLTGTMGSYLIFKELNELNRDALLLTVDLTPKEFLESLVPYVWALEMPNSCPDAIRQWHFVKRCQEEGLSPYFDTGFAQEFYDYTKEARALKSTSGATEPSMWGLASKLAFAFSPRSYLQRLRKSLEATPQIAFLEKRLLLPSEEFARAMPTLSGHFDLNLFIHQFYHLSRIPKLDASLFYLSIKTFVADEISESRLRIAQSHGLIAQSPLIDWRLLEFFASFSPEVWASPDLLASFANFWLEQHETPQTIAKWPKTFPLSDKLLLSNEVMQVFKGLEKGFLADSGLVTPSWIKMALESPQAHLQSLYGMLLLEIWTRLFIDLPLSEENSKIPLQDLLQTRVP